MEAVKLERYNNAFMEQLNIIFGTEVKNQILKSVVVTGVKITNDLSFAKIYFTTLDDDRDKATKALNKASGFIRSAMCDKIQIRKMPELHFVYDESIEYGNKIENIIERLNNEQ